MDHIANAFLMVMDPSVLGVILAASVFGLFIGAIPGLSATMATALLVPLTFFMDPLPAIASIVSAVAMAIFAGDIPGAMLRIPGTPASAAYVDDAYQMTLRGQAERALGIGLVSSVFGGFVGAIILTTCAPFLAEFAFQFSTVEYFWLAVLGLSCSVVISRGTPLKGLISLLIGLFISTIGIDVTGGYPRFTFGSVDLMGGVSFIPAMIGMFAMTEILRFAMARSHDTSAVPKSRSTVYGGQWKMLRANKGNLVSGSLVGTVIGILPGAGSDIAAWVAYAMAKKFSRTPEKFGTGHPEGLAAAGAANNASLSGVWIPALVFGIPGELDHGHRHRRAVHERHHPWTDGLCPAGRSDLRHLHDLLSGKSAAAGAGLSCNPGRAPCRPDTLPSADAGNPAVLHRRIVRHHQQRFRYRSHAGAGGYGISHGGKWHPDRTRNPWHRDRPDAGGQLHGNHDQVGWPHCRFL